MDENKSLGETIFPHPGLQEEDDLIRRHQSGDPGAFDHLYRAHIKPLNAFLWKLHGNPGTPMEEIEDMGQDVMLAAFKGLSRFQFKSRFRTWLFGVALNLFHERLRKKKRAPLSLDAPTGDETGSPWLETLADDGPGAGEALHRREILKAVHTALGELPPNERELIIFRDLEGLTTQEVAEATGQGVRSVQIYLERAHRRLKEILTKRGFSTEEPAP